MKNAIFQFSIGYYGNRDKCIKSVNQYAKKYNIQHFLSQKSVINGPHIGFEKFQLFQLFNYGFDRVLYLDADILITPKAKNIFESYPDINKFYAYDENDNFEWMDRDKYIFNEKENIEWPANNRNKKTYFNSGVMIFSKEIFEKYKNIFDLSDIPNWPEIWYFGEQTIFNYWIVKNKIPFETINHSFNRMDLGKDDINNERYISDFIHYAGPCRYGNKNKDQTIEKDYQALYEK